MKNSRQLCALIKTLLHYKVKKLGQILCVKRYFFANPVTYCMCIKAPSRSETSKLIARVTTRDVWQISELLQDIRTEVEARELSVGIKIQESHL